MVTFGFSSGVQILQDRDEEALGKGIIFIGSRKKECPNRKSFVGLVLVKNGQIGVPLKEVEVLV